MILRNAARMVLNWRVEGNEIGIEHGWNQKSTTILNRDLAALDPAQLLEPLPKRGKCLATKCSMGTYKTGRLPRC